MKRVKHPRRGNSRRSKEQATSTAGNINKSHVNTYGHWVSEMSRTCHDSKLTPILLSTSLRDPVFRARLGIKPLQRADDLFGG